jgi:hypothetical protein
MLHCARTLSSSFRLATSRTRARSEKTFGQGQRRISSLLSDASEPKSDFSVEGYPTPC